MMTASEKGKVYEVLLCAPGMKETAKVEFRTSRKVAFFLFQLLEMGLDRERKEGGGLAHFPQDVADQLREVLNEGLEKAGLTEFYGMLKGL